METAEQSLQQWIVVSVYPSMCREIRMALCGPFDASQKGRWLLRCESPLDFSHDLIIDHPRFQQPEPVYWEVELTPAVGLELFENVKQMVLPVYAESDIGSCDGTYITVECHGHGGTSNFGWTEDEDLACWKPLQEFVNRLIDLVKAPWRDPTQTPPVIESPPDDWRPLFQCGDP